MSEQSSLWVHDLGGPTETIHDKREHHGEDSEWTQFVRAAAPQAPIAAAVGPEPRPDEQNPRTNNINTGNDLAQESTINPRANENRPPRVLGVAPQQPAEPVVLTDEQIRRLWEAAPGMDRLDLRYALGFARAILAAAQPPVPPAPSAPPKLLFCQRCGYCRTESAFGVCDECGAPPAEFKAADDPTSREAKCEAWVAAQAPSAQDTCQAPNCDCPMMDTCAKGLPEPTSDEGRAPVAYTDPFYLRVKQKGGFTAQYEPFGIYTAPLYSAPPHPPVPEPSADAVREALADAITRMDRARSALTDGNPRPDCNWGMLDTTALRAALAASPKDQP